LPIRHSPSGISAQQFDDLREQRQAWRDWEEYRRDQERYRREEWPGYLDVADV
jgi:hypothetical protein